MALIALALIVVGLGVWQYRTARYLWTTPLEPRVAMMYVYVSGVLDALAVLLIGIIIGSLVYS